MTGNLYKTTNGWSIKYWAKDLYYFGSPGDVKEVIKTIPVHTKSLYNPFLSTYWVSGRNVEFEIVCEYDTDGWFDEYYALIIHDDYGDEDGWDKIGRELSEQDINGVYETFKWLKENYNPPVRKN